MSISKLVSPVRLILVLAVLGGLINTLPLIATNLKGVFFTTDPDVMYVSNSLSYIKTRQIHYSDHPGTPAIVMFSHALLPIRLATKYIFHEKFIDWSIKHYDYVFLYLRLFQNLVFSLSLYVFMLAIYKTTQSKLAVVFSWLALFIFSPFSTLSLVISAEVTGFFIVSIWLYLLSAYGRSHSPLLLILLSFVSGFGLANRLTNIFVVLTSICLVFSLKEIRFVHRVRNIAPNIIGAILGFILGSWPIHNSYLRILNWSVQLLNSTDVHGGGKKELFDSFAYFQSLNNLIGKEPLAIAIVLFALLIIVVRLLFYRQQLRLYEVIAFMTTLLGTIIFAKYPLTHYQLNHYVILIFITTAIVSQLSKYFLIFSIPLLLIFFANNLTVHYSRLRSAISSSEALRAFIVQHPPRLATVWEWGLAKDQALLWGNAWSGCSYEPELTRIRPNLYSLALGFQDVNVSCNQTKRLFDTCWDHLYIQQESLETLLKNTSETLNFIPIPQTPMVLIQSSHCSL